VLWAALPAADAEDEAVDAAVLFPEALDAPDALDAVVVAPVVVVAERVATEPAVTVTGRKGRSVVSVTTLLPGKLPPMFVSVQTADVVAATEQVTVQWLANVS
jgi:hypothetical protein